MAIGLNKNNVEDEEIKSDTDDLTDDVEVAGGSNNTRYIIIGVVVVILAIFLISKLIPNGDNNDAESGNDTSVEENVEDVNVSNDDDTTNTIVPGITDFDDYDEEELTTSAKVYDDGEYIKDLNGLDVSAIYNVESVNFVDDYVNYETRRAILDDGMEMYWLEAQYRGKKYRIQIPYYYYKNLGESGICKVSVEVLTLVDGGTIISYMQVVQDSES